MNSCSQLYRQEISDEAAQVYVSTLRHLSPDDLATAFEESLKICKFFPNPAEILKALEDWKDRKPNPGTAQHYPPSKHFAGENQELARGIEIALSNLPKEEKMKAIEKWEKNWARLCAEMPPTEETMEDKIYLDKLLRTAIAGAGEPMPGERWTTEDGWLPREESWRREEEREMRKGVAPRFNVVDGRIAAVAQREPGDD